MTSNDAEPAGPAAAEPAGERPTDGRPAGARDPGPRGAWHPRRLDTPRLVVELEAAEANLARIAADLGGRRPARRQTCAVCAAEAGARA